MTTENESWASANQRWLAAEVTALELRLRRYAGLPGGDDPAATDAARQACDEAAAALPGPSALDVVAQCFGLGAFERNMLLLTAADELDARIGEICSMVNGGVHDRPTFGLALAALDEPHWSAITPEGPLRARRLVDVGDGRITAAPLQIDERVLHSLLGLSRLDRRLRPYAVQVLASDVPLPPSLAAAAGRVRGIWGTHRTGPIPPVVLHGPEPRDLDAVVVAAAHGVPVYRVTAADLPADPADLDSFARLWERESLLDRTVMVLACQDGGTQERRAVAALLDRADAPIVVTAPGPVPLPGAGAHLPVGRPPRSEQRALWRSVLADPEEADDRLTRQIDEAVTQFDMGFADIVHHGTVDAGPSGDSLWNVCRTRSRDRLGDLAQLIEPRARWHQLRLPAEQYTVLRDISAQARGAAKVQHAWTSAEDHPRGLGLSAMFAGPSGTGKTLAAEVIAAELRLDLYRIDLSAVVSKYIGETEKNLRAVFDAAEKGGSVLLFDEADALFGKRTEVRDSHDRYANIEVSYLLQRMESYRGVAILTTNMRSSLDQAFLRRLRFVVNFPFPDAAQRADIWRSAFPAQVPTSGLDPERLARLNVSGGSIRNIAFHASFLAADADEPVTMAHILRAARSEYAKLDRPLTEVEAGGWS
ncbi:AAA family ATPase [Streptomyces sp. ISL-36]|uniref:ATP-binding protein n=1 Tax=Streptomyces sp. ISL-36 TaxID=2819182 RepID=UPI001BE59515|nr:ATP-binding protein [Streptomyces sp. ISL-36]MBT2442708.1 AAA family ATPase [Streptomyces sp. ISL-36]